ncbi:MAG TPA: DUF308 domain-containing protein [Pilimelia sp.]|nr:DUF308 domain-containing protein [Pilimelia sp.]
MSSSVPFVPTEPASGAVTTAEDRKALRLLWWLAIAAAALSIILGIMVVAWPEATLLVAAVIFGIWLIVHGIVHIVRAVTRTADDGAVRALEGIIGVLFVVGGVICLRNVIVSLLAIATIIGITWLIAGIVALVSAFMSRRSGESRLLIAVLGGVTVLGGLAVLVWPDITLLALVYLTGFWLILIGAIQFFILVRARPSATA